MKSIKVISLLFFLFKILTTFVNCEYLKIDSFDNSACVKSTIYKSEWIKLNYCDGNIIYRFVPPNVGGGVSDNSTTTTTTTTTTKTSSSSPTTTIIAGNFSTTTTSDIITTSNIPTTITISPLTGFGNALNVDYLMGSTDSLQSQNNENQTTFTTSSTSDIGTTTTTTTTTSITSIVTSLISTTGSVQGGGIGSVAKYYCLDIGCSSQCVSIQVFPIEVCTLSGLDNVLYSIVNNTSSIITKSTNTTDPGPNNGFCQSFISPKSCISSLNQVSQSKNDHCGKGSKVNCTGSLYSTFTCLDKFCNQCTQTNSYPLNKCTLLNNGSTPTLQIKFLNKNPFISANKIYSIIDSNTEGKNILESDNDISTLISGTQ
ncbi:hypothetical protein RB653_008202 [Dictyostelium firmibasis]|uniref:Uncharacterized protein n=1 Tax=Dictyostelium firmibasis TaxID=79012 RepID=A0AAN7TZZ1_9MYCE